MLDGLIASLISDSGLTPEQMARVKEAAASVVAQMGPIDMLAATGTLMGAKQMLDNGNAQGAMDAVRKLTDRYGVSDVIDEIASMRSVATA